MPHDLFGHPIAEVSVTAPRITHHKSTLEEKRTRYLRLIESKAKTERLIARLEGGLNVPMFTDLLDFLKAPLLGSSGQFHREEVQTLAETGEEVDGINSDIPYEPWGAPWIESHGLKWSQAGVNHLQIQVFWESLEELALLNNEHEKWSVLKWVFMPLRRKLYMYDQRINRSHCLEIHQRDETFSYRNCSMAAKVDGDELREMLRHRLPAELLEAIKKVVTF
jgi:hypothetical protein